MPRSSTRSWTRHGMTVGAIAVLAGCAQFQTSNPERQELDLAAATAGSTYVDCIVAASDRFRQTGESAPLIVEVSKKECSGAREEYVAAENIALKSRYMSTGPILEKRLAALEDTATAQVNERVLEHRAAAPGAVSPASGTAAPVAAAVATPPAASGYLDCMRSQGERYAGLDEPAEVVAEVAQSRCASRLTEPASAAQLERQGRALVMGMVLDQKASRR